MNVLFVGSHMDDIELSSLGTLLIHQENGHNIFYLVLSDCQDIPRNVNLIAENNEILLDLGLDNMIIHSVQNKCMATTENKELIRDILEFYRDSCDIDVVFGPWIDDIHQDHSSVAEEIRRVFRYNTVHHFEIPHSCPKFNPNYYVVLPPNIVKKKIELISKYKSQSKMSYWQEANLLATMRFRGLQIGAEYAEAFIICKLIR